MKKLILMGAMLLVGLTAVQAQKIAVKTNALGWAAFGSINFGAEVALWPRWTLDVDGAYNPWEWGNEGKQSKFWGIQPEVRYWFCRKFAGHFVGLHGQYVDYDFGMRDYIYNGWMSGGGFSYGYVLPFAKRWRAEANIGAGWLHKNYDLTGRPEYPGDVRIYDHVVKNNFGITRAGLSVIFLIY